MEDNKRQIQIYQNDIRFLEDMIYVRKYSLKVAKQKQCSEEHYKSLENTFNKEIDSFNKLIKKHKKAIKELMK